MASPAKIEAAKAAYKQSYPGEGHFIFSEGRKATYLLTGGSSFLYTKPQKIHLYLHDTLGYLLDSHIDLPDTDEYAHNRGLRAYSQSSTRRTKTQKLMVNKTHISNVLESGLREFKGMDHILMSSYIYTSLDLISLKSLGGIPPNLMITIVEMSNLVYQSAKLSAASLTGEDKKQIRDLKMMLESPTSSGDGIMDAVKGAGSSLGSENYQLDTDKSEKAFAVDQTMEGTITSVSVSDPDIIADNEGRVSIAETGIKKLQVSLGGTVEVNRVKGGLVRLKAPGQAHNSFRRTGLSGKLANRVTKGVLASTAGKLRDESNFHLYTVPNHDDHTYSSAFAFLLRKILPGISPGLAAFMIMIVKGSPIGPKKLVSGDLITINMVVRAAAMAAYLAVHRHISTSMRTEEKLLE